MVNPFIPGVSVPLISPIHTLSCSGCFSPMKCRLVNGVPVYLNFKEPSVYVTALSVHVWVLFSSSSR